MTQTTDPGNTLTYQFSRIPDGPKNIPEVYGGMKTIDSPLRSSFIDRAGHFVRIPQRDSGKSYTDYFDPAYAKALWDFRNGNMLLGETKENTDIEDATLYVRDVDRTGQNRLLDTWHAISNLESEYHATKAKSYPVWNLQMKVECSKLPGRVRHGIKFSNRAYLRSGTARELTVIDQTAPEFTDPFELVVDRPYSTSLMKQASSHLRDVTTDDHSAKNLARMFATPLLEKYKHLTFILFGDGGNGKGLLLSTLSRSYPEFAKSIDSQRILGGRRASGGFDTQQETGKLIGALWAFDEDADSISIDQLTYLKKISTGDPVTARRIGENAVNVRPRCTFIIATNNSIVTTLTAASARRYVYVRMRDGRAPSDFEKLIAFIDQYGADPFIMLSCDLWAREGDDPYTDVSIGSADDVTELEQDIIDAICTDGYAESSALADLSRSGQRDTLAKLGLKRMGKKWIPERSVSIRVIGVKDEQRFHPYRLAWQETQRQLESQLIRPKPSPIDDDGIPLPVELGFDADYVAADAQKVARNWKKQVENPQINTSLPPYSPAFAIVPAPGFAIIDMDMGKTSDDPDGWEILQAQIGAYGSDAFPSTYLVGTPSGGVHAYFALPDELKGKLKNSVHPDGIPIDIRTERRGYVIAAGSTTASGEYQLLDLPEDKIPQMPPALVAWLEANGYVEGAETKPIGLPGPVLMASSSNGLPTLAQMMNAPASKTGGRPDMAPIPEGQRNKTLFDWTLGRLVHYPGNEPEIKADLFQRGHISGLKDLELETIWNSAVRTSKETTR